MSGRPLLSGFAGELPFREANLNETTRQVISAVAHHRVFERRGGRGDASAEVAAAADEDPVPFYRSLVALSAAACEGGLLLTPGR